MAMKKNSFILILFFTIFCSCNKDDLIWDLKKFATISIISATNISNTSVTINGEVKYDGGSTVVQRGICWSTNQNPTIADNITSNGSGSGSFTSYITSLNANTTYYSRAYATNGVGTAYGNQINFTTTNISGSIATLTTVSAGNLADNSAVSGGNITSDGGSTVTQRGVCWSTNVNPTIADNITTNGSGSGSFTSSITSLNSNTTYYYRAYATNGVGTVYGNQSNFSTPTFSIGQSHQGGKIAYILQAGDIGYDANVQHGIIAAPSDQFTGAPWGCYGTLLSGADGTAIGTGNQNTIDIMNGCSEAGIAARICGDLVLGGYSDWYLPSKDELHQLYINRVAIGGPNDGYYWSSTENGGNNAWDHWFYNNYQYSNQKVYGYGVLAVRSF